MPPSSEPSRSGTAVLLSAPGLSVVALVLFVLFGSLVTPALFPLQLLDPAWQLRFAGTLINSAPFPLLGLALLQIAVELGAHNPQLKSRQKFCSQLAVAVALGFLLLLPLQTIAGLQTSRTLNTAQASRIQGAERRLVVLRQAVASATSNEEINQRLQRLQGPVLGPADIAQPLPLLKAQVGAVLDQAAMQIARERQATPPTNPWRLLPELLRNGIACLALALGFAALAVRPGSERSLLQEWQGCWSGLLKSLRQRRASSGSASTSNAEYFRQIRGIVTTRTTDCVDARLRIARSTSAIRTTLEIEAKRWPPHRPDQRD
ncbi:MAG: HpsJ family protein [Cyanobacteria bacterium]|nr:HpsJ family protein [Cyanobacteriota bacterium]